MSTSLVTINLVVLNGEKYIRHCLDAVLAQTYPRENMEINILDNNSTDGTKKVIRDLEIRILDLGFAKFFLLESKKNLGVWPGQEELLKYTNGKYIVTLCVDVLIDKDFVKNSVEAMEKDEKIGALQPKIYKFDHPKVEPRNIFEVRPQKTTTIDTAGFKIFRSRRIINIGHGLSFAEASESKEFNFDKQQEIFAVEGAVPVFRKKALESCRINKSSEVEPRNISEIRPQTEIVDHNYFWYGDDLDLTWRMRLFGWKQVFAPNVVAWHARQTTKSVKKSWSDYITRVPVRKQIPIKKRRLDWRNTRWTLVKNDYMINILRDLPWIISREIAVLGYAVLFEPGVLKEIQTFFKYLPEMIQKRKEIMRRTVATPKEIRRWVK